MGACPLTNLSYRWLARSSITVEGGEFPLGALGGAVVAVADGSVTESASWEVLNRHADSSS